MEKIIKPNLIKAEISGAIKMFSYTLIFLLLISFFIYIISQVIDLELLTSSLSMMGIAIPNLGNMMINAIIIIFLTVIGNAVFIYLKLNNKEVKFYDNKLSFYKSTWLDVPYKNVVSTNYSKNIFKGDTITLTLTGTAIEKIEIPYVDNIEEECKNINDLTQNKKNEISPIPKPI